MGFNKYQVQFNGQYFGLSQVNERLVSISGWVNGQYIFTGHGYVIRNAIIPYAHVCLAIYIYI